LVFAISRHFGIIRGKSYSMYYIELAQNRRWPPIWPLKFVDLPEKKTINKEVIRKFFYSRSIDQLCHFLHENCVNLNRKTQSLYNFTYIAKNGVFHDKNSPKSTICSIPINFNILFQHFKSLTPFNVFLCGKPGYLLWKMFFPINCTRFCLPRKEKVGGVNWPRKLKHFIFCKTSLFDNLNVF